MTFDSFNNCNIIVGIALCALIALVIITLTKILYQDKGKHTENQRKEKGKSKINVTDCMFETKELATGISFKDIMKERRKTSAPTYKTMFLVNAEISARSGKQVNIREKYHERITKITQVAGNNKITIFSYIDNVLKHHFENFQNEISELYNKNNEDDYLTPKK